MGETKEEKLKLSLRIVSCLLSFLLFALGVYIWFCYSNSPAGPLFAMISFVLAFSLFIVGCEGRFR